MNKIYTLSAAALLSVSMMAQSTLQLDKPTKLNLSVATEKAQDALRKFENASKSKASSFKKAGEILLSEDFETETIPATWTLSSAASSAGWMADTASAALSWSPTETSPLAVFGLYNWFAVSNDAKHDDGSNSNDASEDYLVSPTMDFTSISSALLQFDFYFNPTKSFSTATVEVSTDAGTTWASILTVTGNAAWQVGTEVDLSSYAGESDVTLRFGHNDNGNAATGFAIDNILVQEVAVDLQLTVEGNIYSHLPQQHAEALELTAFVSNTEVGDATDVVLEGTVTDPSAASTAIVGDLPTVIEGQSDTSGVVSPNVTTSALGVHTYDLTIVSAESDETPENNTVTFDVSVNDTLYARNNGIINTSYGIGDGEAVEYIGWPYFDKAEPGSIFTFATDDSITSVEFAFGADAAAGDEIEINLYPVSAGVPDVSSPLATSATAIKTTAVGTSEIVTVQLNSGFYPTVSGEQIFAAAKLVSSATGNSFVGGDSLDIFTEYSGAYVVDGFGLLTSGYYPNVCNPYIRLILGEFDATSAKADIAVAAILSDVEYATTPLVHAQAVEFEVEVDNLGAANADAVEATISVLLAGSVVYNNQVAIGTVTAGARGNVTSLGSFTPAAVGVYKAVISLTTTSEETGTSNNISDTLSIAISDTIYNRAVLANLSSFNFGPNLDVGTGTPDNVTVGTTYELLSADTITSVTFVTAGDEKVGDEFIINVYDASNTLVGTSDVFTVEAAGSAGSISVITLTFGNGLPLASGSYFTEIAAVSTTDDAPRSFVMTTSIITEGASLLILETQSLRLDMATAFGPIGYVPVIEVALGIASTVGINETTGLEVSLFPNPAKNELNIANAANSTYRLINIAGKVVSEGNVDSALETINVSKMPSGLYVLQLSGAVNESTRVIID